MDLRNVTRCDAVQNRRIPIRLSESREVPRGNREVVPVDDGGLRTLVNAKLVRVDSLDRGVTVDNASTPRVCLERRAEKDKGWEKHQEHSRFDTLSEDFRVHDYK
jgi:hypothetical protein